MFSTIISNTSKLLLSLFHYCSVHMYICICKFLSVGDALTFHNGLPFTTKDRDNDFAQGHNCASIYKGGWWFGNCMYANLNGVNIAKQDTDSSAMGIIWYDLTGFHSSLRFASMAIRPTS